MLDTIIYAELLQQERRVRFASPEFTSRVSLAASLRNRVSGRTRREPLAVRQGETRRPVLLPY